MCFPHRSQRYPLKPKLMSFVTPLLRISQWSSISLGEISPRVRPGSLGPTSHGPGFPPLSSPRLPCAHTFPPTLMAKHGPAASAPILFCQTLSPHLLRTSLQNLFLSEAFLALLFEVAAAAQEPGTLVFRIGVSSVSCAMPIYVFCLFAVCPRISTRAGVFASVVQHVPLGL